MQKCPSMRKYQYFEETLSLDNDERSICQCVSWIAKLKMANDSMVSSEYFSYPSIYPFKPNLHLKSWFFTSIGPYIRPSLPDRPRQLWLNPFQIPRSSRKKSIRERIEELHKECIDWEERLEKNKNKFQDVVNDKILQKQERDR